MAGLMYFGTRSTMKWIACPRSGLQNNPVRWGSDGVFLNGGAYVRRSVSSHERYDVSWEMLKDADLTLITDLLDNPGPYYMLNPFATNVLPRLWASPYFTAVDGPTLTGTGATDGNYTVANTPANTLGYPDYSLDLENSPTVASSRPALYIPVPPGQNFYFGWHGSGTGIKPTITPNTGTAVTPAALAVTSTTRTNAVFTNPGGVTIRLTGSGPVVMSGMMGFIGTAPPVAGGFVPGRGNSGVELVPDSMQITGYSAPAALNLQSMSMTLVEVGSWAL